MSDHAIVIEGVGKTFRRFQHPGWRALDALGFGVPKSRYDEFVALHDIDLKIRRGEKVALIGRNGAGKSTLLRVISGQMRADTGRVAICGSVQALMELGTGFHPDFTGVDNIRSSLAYQGVSPGSVGPLIDEIVEFTELEKFIERPVREYSAGMYARLAFAVATSVTPDVLIIDEILGAGDAYFVGKCIQRMKSLTTQGATVLFVSHDMSAVQLLCDRGVWIERGTVRADGDVLAVSKAYLASVREDEELRMRARSLSLSKSALASDAMRSEIAIYRLLGEGGQPPRHPAAVAEIRFGDDARTLGSIVAHESGSASRFIFERGATNWSSAELVDGRTSRKFGRYGGKYLHAPWQIDWSGAGNAARWMEIDLLPSASDVLMLEFFDEQQQKYVPLAQIGRGAGAGGWQTHRVALPDRLAPAPLPSAASLDLQALHPDDRYGDGPIKITAFGFISDEQERRHTLISGETAMAVIAYAAEAPVADPVAVVAVYRPDGTCALQVSSNRSGLALGKVSGEGQITVVFSPLLLGPGDYIASVALFRELNIASRHEPEAYDLHDRCYALRVLPPPGIGVEIGIVNQPASWEIAS